MTQDEMQFIENLFRSLETEMSTQYRDVKLEFTEMRARFDRVETRLDRIETRMDRIGGLVNGGSRVIGRLVEWSERTDQFQMDTLRRLDDLNSRVTRIEAERQRPGSQA